MSADAALVTGAATRIGRAIAEALGGEGRPIAIHYNRSADQAEEAKELVEKAGGRAATVQCDLADPHAVSDLIASAAMALGTPLGCLVNNAALFEYDNAAGLTAGSFDAHMGVNARAPALLMRAFAQHVAGTAPPPESPVIVNILDQKLNSPDPDYLSYTISKYALEGLTRTMALALAPTIRVVGIAPGLTLPSDRMDDVAFAAAQKATLLARGTEPQDIAHAVCYAASAPSVTGQTITVDAGQHLQPSRRDVAFATGTFTKAKES